MTQAATAPAFSQDGQTLSFASVLLSASRDGGLRKTERTRLRLMASIAEQLASGVDRNDLKVANIAASAGLAHGTLYRYFTDIRDATEALIKAFSEFLRDQLADAREGETGSRERVRGATLTYTRLFRENAALMRCLIGLGGENSDFARSYQSLNRDWNMRMAAAIARRRAPDSEGNPVPPAACLPTACALGGMIDEFLSQLYLRKDPALANLIDDEGAVADLLSDLWCLGAYGGVPEQ